MDKKCSDRGSNSGPLACEASVITTTLSELLSILGLQATETGKENHNKKTLNRKKNTDRKKKFFGVGNFKKGP